MRQASRWPVSYSLYARMLFTLLLLVGLAGCTGYDQRMAEAYDYVDRYLSAVRGGEPDYGWSMFDRRHLPMGYDEYADAAESADWSRFRHEVLIGACDDLVACNISVAIPGAPETVPAFLVESGILSLNDFDRDGVVDPAHSEAGNAQIQVWFARFPWEPSGIRAGD